MRLRDWIVPDEIQSAQHAASELIQIASKTSHFWLKQLVAGAIPLIIGAVLAFVIVGKTFFQPTPSGLTGVISSILTLTSVLAGFMVTLMLFTGRTTGTSSLTVDQLPYYINKITYLVFSQAFTLFILIATAALCIVWLAMFTNTNSWSHNITLFAASISGFTILSLFRVLLLPFQIYEVHRFELDSLYQEKIAEWERSLKEK